MDRIRRLVPQIQNLHQTEAEELFKILHRNNCDYTVNNNGVFINMSWLNDKILAEIEQFIHFCTHSSVILEEYENICSELTNEQKHTVCEKESVCVSANKDPVPEPVATDGDDVPTNIPKSKMTSSMRFYLLKKRFSKGQVHATNAMINDLEPETYVL